MPLREAVLVVAVSLLAAACPSDGDAPGNGDTKAEDSKACGLLSREEVESFVGEPVHDARPDDAAEGVTDTCRWGDADPAPPGHVLSLSLTPAGAVEDVEPSAADNVYDVSSLGEGAVGIQQAGGGVRVVFAVKSVRVDLVYDVVPIDARESDAIDRLIRLAERIRERV